MVSLSGSLVFRFRRDMNRIGDAPDFSPANARQAGEGRAVLRTGNPDVDFSRLVEENNRLQQIVDALPAMTGYVDLNQRIVFANRQLESWYCLSRDDLIGMSLRDLFTDEHYHTVETLLEQVLSGKEVSQESTITYRDGVCRDVHLNYIPDVQDGRVLGYFFLVRDISTRKRTERELRQAYEKLDERIRHATAALESSNRELREEIRIRRETEEQLRANQEWLDEALESMTDGFLLFDSDGCLVASNSRIVDLFPSIRGKLNPGVSFRDLLRISAGSGEVREAVGRVDEWLEERMADYLNQKGSVEVQLSDGRWIMATDRRTRTGGVVGLRTDITERKQAEEKIRQQQEQMAAVLRRASMGEMASALAHELSQPLTAITYYARGSLRRLENCRDRFPEVVDALEKSTREAERAKAILSHVGEFVRNSVPSVNEHDMVEIVNAVFELAEASLRRNGIKWRKNLPNAAVLVQVNRIEMEQVVFNLIRNSIDSLKQAPSQDRFLSVSVVHDSRTGCEVSVADNGSGVSDDIVGRLFEPYVTTKDSGLGMGLPISRTIVESHGGRLRVDESCTTGARLTFNLPDARIDGA